MHPFQVLSEDEIRWLLEQRWNHLGIHIRVDDFTDQEALAAIVRILEINDLRTVTKDVVETARESLVLGQA